MDDVKLLTPEEAQDAGNERTPPARREWLRTRLTAGAKARELAQARKAADAVLLGRNIDPRGKKYRDAQLASDAQLIGMYPDLANVRDPALRQQILDAQDRIRGVRETAARASDVERLEAELQQLQDAIPRLGEDAAREAHKAKIAEARRDLARCQAHLNDPPYSRTTAEQVRNAAARLAQLEAQQP